MPSNCLSYVPVSEIQRIREALEAQYKTQKTSPFQGVAILADIFRLNTLYMIAMAGSGHIGSSFSCLDIITWLWTREMKHPNEARYGDLCFSSKGHDVPGFYSLLIGLEKLDEQYLHQLRQLGGLPGHPDVGVPYIVTNTGSLGMGISKARGMVYADRLNGLRRNIFVLTGDGELQEGHFWESLQPAANAKMAEITVIVDHNKIQSDLWIRNVSDLGDLETKLAAFGWETARCDGHDAEALNTVLRHFETVTDRPKILIADTLKGRGVSFMEPHNLAEHALYGYHSGAPSIPDYENALSELKTRIDCLLEAEGIPAPSFIEKARPVRPVAQAPQRLVKAYGEELAALAAENEDLIALDGDLMLDTGLIPFKDAFPERYIECGIAEQDMVSVAGGLALQGKLPVVHSFSCFLSTRPNEHIYNNATERTKVIYAGSLAGLLPSGPGHSHQSLRDISILGSVPGLTLFEPSNEQEARMGLRWAVEDNPHSTYIRLVSIPVDTAHALPADYRLVKGQGVVLTAGRDAVLFTYGPIMVSEAVKAAKILAASGIDLAVVNLPWLNAVDTDWLRDTVAPYPFVFTLDNHYLAFGQGQYLAAAMAGLNPGKPVIQWGIEDIPRCGLNHEVLSYYQFDAAGLAARIESGLHYPPGIPMTVECVS